jgi:hypothetical protein
VEHRRSGYPSGRPRCKAFPPCGMDHKPTDNLCARGMGVVGGVDSSQVLFQEVGCGRKRGWAQIDVD